MLMPAAMIMANRATTQEVRSARPDAPLRDDRPARRLPRLRAAIARAIKPHEPRRAARTPRDILDATRSVIAGWHG